MTLAAIVASLGSPQSGKPSTPLAALGAGISVNPTVTFVSSVTATPAAAVGAGFGVTPSVSGSSSIVIAAQEADGAGVGVAPAITSNNVVMSSTGTGTGVNPTVTLPSGHIAHVQDSPSNTSIALPVTLTLPNLPTVNNWLTVVVGGASSSTVPVFLVSGGGVGTWLKVRENSTLSAAEIWYGQVTGTPSTTITVGLASGNVSQGQQCTASEWSGVVQSDPNATGATGTSTTAAPGAYAPSANGDVILVSYGNPNSFTSTPAGWSALGATLHSGVGAWLIGSSAVNPSVSINLSGTWAAVAVGLCPVNIPSVPQAPTGVTAVPGNASVTVGWTPPTVGAIPTSYQVLQTHSGGSGGSTASGTSAIITGLTNGTAYTWTVEGTTSAGNGPASSPGVVATPSGGGGGAPLVVLWAGTDSSNMNQAQWNQLAAWGFGAVTFGIEWPYGFGGGSQFSGNPTSDASFNLQKQFGPAGGATSQSTYAHNAGMKCLLQMYLENGQPTKGTAPCVGNWVTGNWSGSANSWNTMMANIGDGLAWMGFDGMGWDTEGDTNVSWVWSAGYGTPVAQPPGGTTGTPPSPYNTQAAMETLVTSRAASMMTALRAGINTSTGLPNTSPKYTYPVYTYLSGPCWSNFPGTYKSYYEAFVNNSLGADANINLSVWPAFCKGLGQASNAAVVCMDSGFYGYGSAAGSNAPFYTGNTNPEQTAAWTSTLNMNINGNPTFAGTHFPGFAALGLPSNVYLTPFVWLGDNSPTKGGSTNWTQGQWNNAVAPILANASAEGNAYGVYQFSNRLTSGSFTIDYSNNRYSGANGAPAGTGQNYTPLN